MARYDKNRIIPIVIVIIIVFVAVAALVSLTRAIFFSGTTQQGTSSQLDSSEESLLSSVVGRSVRMTVRGPIVADEQFHSYQISASPAARSLTTYVGYLNTVQANEQLTNNIPAYEQLVYALNRGDFMKGTELTSDKNETRGICATGRLYEFEILKDTVPVKKLWTTSCRDSSGSLDANVKQMTALFTKQIPDASALTSKIGL